MASSTGEVTNERLSLTVLAPALASRRASETELAGIHMRGSFAQFGGPLADEAVDHLIGVGGFDADLDAPVADRGGRLVVVVRKRLYLIGDGCVGDDGDGQFAVHTSGGRDIAAVGQRVTEEPPQDDRADHHDDGDEGGDHADADAAPAGGHRAVAACPFAAVPFSAVLRARARPDGRGRRRSGCQKVETRGGFAALEFRLFVVGRIGRPGFVVGELVGVGPYVVRVAEILCAIARFGIVLGPVLRRVVAGLAEAGSVVRLV